MEGRWFPQDQFTRWYYTKGTQGPCGIDPHRRLLCTQFMAAVATTTITTTTTILPFPPTAKAQQGKHQNPTHLRPWITQTAPLEQEHPTDIIRPRGGDGAERCKQGRESQEAGHLPRAALSGALGQAHSKALGM